MYSINIFIRLFPYICNFSNGFSITGHIYDILDDEIIKWGVYDGF